MERPAWLVPVGTLLLFASFGLVLYVQDASNKQKIATARKTIERCISQRNTTSSECTSAQYHLPQGDRLRSKFREEWIQARKAKMAKLEEAAAKRRRVAAEVEKARQAAAKKLADAGWIQQLPGIYVRWCTKTCSKAEVIGDNLYALLEVWCKERACGDIYAQVNFVRNGTVVGWTNDTLYLGSGQKGVLTFQKYGYKAGGSVELVKFNAGR